METITKEKCEIYNRYYHLHVKLNLKFLTKEIYELTNWGKLFGEVEDMGIRHFDRCVSHLAVILEHLYKWDHFRWLTRAGKEKGGLSWVDSVENARDELEVLFERYPSLRAKLPQGIDKAWKDAIKRIRKWLRKLSYDPERFKIPQKCPYTYEEAMTRDLRKEVEKWV